MAMCEREATHVSADATRGADYSDPDVMIGDLDGRHSTFIFGFTPRLPIYLITCSERVAMPRSERIHV
jgi:hypothetical protein